METNLSSLLNQLSRELERVKSPLVDFFQPGIEKKEIEEKLKKGKVTLKFPSEVFDLYKWRNGLKEEIWNSKTIGEVSLFSLGIFSSFTIALRHYNYYAVQNDYWNKKMFPLWESGGGDFYLIDCNKKSRTYRRIMYYSNADPVLYDGVKSKFDSVEIVIQTVLECYQKGIYRYNHTDGNLESDYKREIEVFLKNNPQSEYWKIAFEM